MKRKLKQYHEQELLLESLKESVETLKEAQAALGQEIIKQVMDTPELCNGGRGKRRWKGFDGKYFFSIDMAARLARFSSNGNGDLEGQEWLEKVSADLGSAYVRRRLILNKRAITGAVVSGELDAAKLKAVKLRYESEPALNVKRLASNEELESLIEEASEIVTDEE